MSTSFSDTTNKKGLVQLCESWCSFSDGDISGNATLLAKFTAWMNLGLDDIWAAILQASGLWQLDDSNYTDYPFITTNLVSGQRDYSFVTDGSGNVILDIYRVMIADSTGVYREIYPVDIQKVTELTGNAVDTTSFIDGQNASGTPTRYDKTGNSIFLDVVPNYNQTNGLKVFINREASYFKTTDTDKKPGFAGLFQTYPALYASELYAGIKSLSNLKKLTLDKTTMRRSVEEYYCKRAKDTPNRLIANTENNR